MLRIKIQTPWTLLLVDYPQGGIFKKIDLNFFWYLLCKWSVINLIGLIWFDLVWFGLVWIHLNWIEFYWIGCDIIWLNFVIYFDLILIIIYLNARKGGRTGWSVVSSPGWWSVGSGWSSTVDPWLSWSPPSWSKSRLEF